MKLDIKVRGLVELQKSMAKFGLEFQGVAVEAAAEYLVGDSSRGLKHEPNYKTVSRKSAYGQSFQSDRQRRWFFWALSSGKINPGVESRTHAISQGWGIQSSGTFSRITNNAPGIGWVMGSQQARQIGLAGWRTYDAIVSTNIKGMARASTMAVQALIRQRFAYGNR